jgi:hypothetical protein
MKNSLSILAVLALFGCTDSSHILGVRPAPPTEMVYVYVSPAGNDSGNGTIEHPLATLAGVQDHLRITVPMSDVTVRIRSDHEPYIDQTVIWDYHNAPDSLSPEYNITFEAYPDSLYACFIGSNADTNFFTLDRHDNGATNVHFRKLSIRRYRTGAIWFCGNRVDDAEGWNGYNSIEDCIFYEIGSQWQPDKLGCYGVLDFMNSRFNVIWGCEFRDCANAYDTGFPQGDVEAEVYSTHTVNAIYLAHHSTNILVIGNTFTRIKGDAVRIRDQSNNAEICYNSFYQTGWSGIVTMWYCHPAYVPWGYCRSLLPIDECPSWFASFHDNYVEGNWTCGQPRLFYDLRPSDNEACEMPIDPYRIDLWNNTVGPCRDGNSQAKQHPGDYAPE